MFLCKTSQRHQRLRKMTKSKVRAALIFYPFFQKGCGSWETCTGHLIQTANWMFFVTVNPMHLADGAENEDR